MMMMIANMPPPVVLAVRIIVQALQDAIESEDET
jgi:hypothetical protein